MGLPVAAPGYQPLTPGNGSQVSPLPTSQYPMIRYIYTHSQEGKPDTTGVEGRKKGAAGGCWPPRAICCSGDPAHLCGATGSSLMLLEVRALSKRVGEAARCCSPTPRWLAAGHQKAGLVGRLPVHSEAVDAGIFWVAPVSQDPQLHHLVCGHHRGLKVKCLNRLAILIISKLAKECPLLL